MGYYTDSGGAFHGFTYNTSTHAYNTFNDPGASGTNFYGISGNNIAGSYTADGSCKAQAFVYNITNNTYTPLAPGAQGPADTAQAFGIDGNNIVGGYNVLGGNTTGFETSIITTSSVPIPGAFLLFGSGLVGLAGLKRKYIG